VFSVTIPKFSTKILVLSDKLLGPGPRFVPSRTQRPRSANPVGNTLFRHSSPSAVLHDRRDRPDTSARKLCRSCRVAPEVEGGVRWGDDAITAWQPRLARETGLAAATVAGYGVDLWRGARAGAATAPRLYVCEY